MGGIIAIDFIDMAKREHNKQLTDAMKEAMKRDKAKHNIMSPSRFGVMEMTRQRVREVADVATQDACPSCNGSGKIQASILITDKIERSLQYLAEGEGRKTLNLVVHPMLEAYLLQGWWWQTIKRGWEKKFGLKLTVDSNSSMEIMEFHIFNSLGEEVTLD
jgi:ribonuclease G